MHNRLFADVIINITHENVDRPFTYAVPEDLKDKVMTGYPVMVPFGSGNVRRQGYVIAVRTDPGTGIDPEKIKEISGISEKGLPAVQDLIRLAFWMHVHYGCMLNQALMTVLPVKKKVKSRKESTHGLPEKTGVFSNPELKPNAEQEKAIRIFQNDIKDGKNRVYLLNGITGSGKTEVYIEMIRTILNEKKQAILLIPEISMTYQTLARLCCAFGDRVAIVHSRLSAGEKYAQFKKVQEGKADIMVGPRSAVFAPFARLGLVILDEEHDSAYKNDTVPRYDTREIAEQRARQTGASVVLGSATPSVESYLKAKNGIYTMLTLTQRAVKGAALAATHVVDMRTELKEGNRSVFSRLLQRMIRERLDRKEQVILFMNRRGYSNFVSCRSCGNAVKCPHCDVTLTLHADGMLRCHYCGYEIPMPSECPTCGSPYIAGFGTGTQKLEKLAGKMFPDARILRMDADATAKKDAGYDILSEFASGKADILIGTQMVVKGHDIANVTLVGIVAADTELYVSSFDSAEKTFQLLTQAAGRAGRGKSGGDVVIQTYRPDHYAIRDAAAQDYGDFVRNELAYREIGNYPPRVHILTVQISSVNEQKLQRAAERYLLIVGKAAGSIVKEKEEVMIIGPARAGIYKIHDYYRKCIYIKHASYDILLGIKNRAEQEFREGCPEGISVLYDFA